MENQSNPKIAIIFDFGGVLIDWNPRFLYRKLFDSNEEAMEAFLEEIHFTEWNLKQDAGRSFQEGVEELCGQFPQYCELIQAYNTRWEESLNGIIQPTVDILRAVKKQGYPVFGMSNWSVEKYKLVRHKYEFITWFEGVIISGEVRLKKPDPRIFSLLLELVKRPPQECLFIDDSIKNIETAHKMGIHAVHYISPEQLVEELRRFGVVV